MKVVWVVLGLLILVLGVAAVKVWSHLEWVDHSADLGFTQKANQQPYLAARRFLAGVGVHERVQRGMSMLDRTGEGNKGALPTTKDAIFLFDGYGMLSPERAHRLLKWVRSGGQLLMSAENPYLDFSLPRPDPIFSHFGISVSNAGAATGTKRTSSPAPAYPSTNKPACGQMKDKVKFTFSGDARAIEVGFAGDHVLKLPPKAKVAQLSDSQGLRFVEIPYGKGRVTLVASAGQWRNAYISCLDNAYFLWQMTPPNGKVWWLINQRGPSLWLYLWKAVPLLLVVLALSVLLWLWFKSLRFGPIRRPDQAAGARFEQHLLAGGQYLWRLGQAEMLLTPLRKAIARQASRQLPAFDSLAPLEKIQTLVELTGMDAAQVKAALTETPQKSEHFTRLMTTLAELRKRLWNL